MDKEAERLFLTYQEALFDYMDYMEPKLDPDNPSDKDTLKIMQDARVTGDQYRSRGNGACH